MDESLGWGSIWNCMAEKFTAGRGGREIQFRLTSDV